MRVEKGAELRTVLILPEHSRDERRLLEAAEFLEEDANYRVLIVRRPAIWATVARLRNARQDTGAEFVYWEWPSTSHGTNLDGGLGLEAQTLRKQLVKKFGHLETILVSDIVGDQAALAVEFQRAEGTRVVLVPEGLSVLANTISSRWVERSWKSAAGLIFRDTWLELGDFAWAKLCNGRQRRWRRKIRPGWRFRRIARLIASRPNSPAHSRLSTVHAVLSDWPEFVEIPVDSREFFVRPNSQLSNSARGPKKLNALVIIGQPLDISRSTWCQGLSILKSEIGKIDRVVLRPHPDREFEEPLVAAIMEVFPDARVEINERRTELEPWLVDENFGYICGVSSTVLFDELVWRRTDSSLLCLYEVLFACASETEQSLLRKQFSAIECLRRYSYFRGPVLLERK